MEAEGFDIYAVTMQNEPLNHGNSMSLYMPWKDQLKFIKILGPAIQKAGLDTKIMLFDHNYNYDGKSDQNNYPLNIYADPEAYKWAAGSAWHNYGGHVSELDEIYATNPEKGIWFTEASIGEWNYDLAGKVGGRFNPFVLEEFSNVFMGTMRRGGKGVTYWNLMLDEKKGPYSPHDGSCKTCYGGVTISSLDYESITKNAHWYHVAHASAVVKPGAKRIAIGGMELPTRFECMMFLNPDNTVGTLICNNSDQDQAIIFANTKFTVKYTVPAKSLVSLIWQE
jgi:glucosylceramidase